MHISWSGKNTFVAALLFLSGFCVVNAQDLLNMSIEELMNVKITTSSKTEQAQWQASAKTIVISEETIRQRGYQDLMDLLRDLPQFQVQSQFGHWTKGGIVNLRGHRSGDSGNNKFLILIDGLKVSDDAEEGLYMGLNSLPLDFIKQVEVVYGPNSTLYGRDAYTGMINLITRQTPFVKSGVSYGTYNSRRFYAGTLQQFGQGLQLKLYYSRYQSNEQDPTGNSVSFTNRTVFPAAPYTKRFYRASDNSNLYFSLTAGHFTALYNLYEICGSETYGGNPNYYVSEYSTQARQFNHIIAFSYKGDLGTKFSYELLARLKRYEFDPQTANLYTDDAFRGPITNPADSSTIIDPFYAYGGRKYYYFRTRAYRGGVKTIYRITPSFTLVSGADLNLVHGIPVTSEGKGGKPISSERQRKPLEHTFDTKSIFSELDMELGRGFYASAGARWDINSNYANTLMPRLGLIYKTDNHLLKAMYAQGYLAPSISQNDLESITTFSWIQPNPDLEPERVTDYELNWTARLGNLRLSAGVFYNSIDDGILESVQTGDSAYVQISNETFLVPILKSRNGVHGYRSGSIIELETPLYKNLSLKTAYSYILGADNTDHTVDLSKNLVSTHTLYTSLHFQRQKFSCYLSGYWASARKIKSQHAGTDYEMLVDADGYDYFPAFFLADMNLRVQEIYPGLSVYFTVRNIFNKTYYGQTINAQWGSPKVLQDLRRMTLGIELDI